MEFTWFISNPLCHSSVQVELNNEQTIRDNIVLHMPNTTHLARQDIYLRPFPMTILIPIIFPNDNSE